MEDNKKDLNVLKDELSETADKVAVTEDAFSNAVDKTGEYTDKALDDELERLAATFKQELKKAQEMTEEELVKNGIVIQQYEDGDGVIPEEELCQCCGEQRRDKTFGENYEYCRKCREAMKNYPFDVKSFIVLAATVFLCVLSIFSFVENYDKYNIVYKGDMLVSEGKLFSALEMYDSAIESFEKNELVPQKLYLKTADILFNTMPEGVSSMEAVAEKVENAISPLESKFPIYYKYTNMRDEVLVINGTFQECYTVLNSEEYAGLDYLKKDNYEKIMTDIGSIIDREVIVTSIDGKETKRKTNEAAVRFCQYMFAYSTENYDDCYKYMVEVSELAPESLWLYAYELGNVKLQKGEVDEAKRLADALHNLNVENVGSYILYSCIYRMNSQPEKAIEWADKGLKVLPEETELMRMKAMAYITQGELELAKETIDSARETNDYGLLMLVSLVVENELGNEAEVKEIKKTLKEYSLDIPERIENYLDKKISAKELFVEGVGDVQ